MNAYKYLYALIVLSASSLTLNALYDLFIIDPSITLDNKMLDEKLEKPEVTVTQENNELIIKTSSKTLEPKSALIKIMDNKLVAEIPDHAASITLEIYSDEHRKADAMMIKSLLKTYQEEKDDKGIVTSHYSGMSKWQETRTLPARIGDLNNTSAEYEEHALVLHIPLKPIKEPRLIAVQEKNNKHLCKDDPGLK